MHIEIPESPKKEDPRQELSFINERLAKLNEIKLESLSDTQRQAVVTEQEILEAEKTQMEALIAEAAKTRE